MSTAPDTWPRRADKRAMLGRLKREFRDAGDSPDDRVATYQRLARQRVDRKLLREALDEAADDYMETLTEALDDRDETKAQDEAIRAAAELLRQLDIAGRLDRLPFAPRLAIEPLRGWL